MIPAGPRLAAPYATDRDGTRLPRLSESAGRTRVPTMPAPTIRPPAVPARVMAKPLDRKYCTDRGKSQTEWAGAKEAGGKGSVLATRRPTAPAA